MRKAAARGMISRIPFVSWEWLFATDLLAIHPLVVMIDRRIAEGVAATTAVATAAGTAAGLTLLLRGKTRGAPGVSHALSRLGKLAGGGMIAGIALAAGSGAAVGLTVYRSIRALRG